MRQDNSATVEALTARLERALGTQRSFAEQTQTLDSKSEPEKNLMEELRERRDARTISEEDWMIGPQGEGVGLELPPVAEREARGLAFTEELIKRTRPGDADLDAIRRGNSRLQKPELWSAVDDEIRAEDEVERALWILGDHHPLHLAPKEAAIYAAEQPQRRLTAAPPAPHVTQTYPPTPVIDQPVASLHGESLGAGSQRLLKLVEEELYGR